MLKKLINAFQNTVSITRWATKMYKDAFIDATKENVIPGIKDWISQDKHKLDYRLHKSPAYVVVHKDLIRKRNQEN